MTAAALVARFFPEVLNEQNAAAAGEILATDFTVHHPASKDPIRGFVALADMAAKFRIGFPDLRYDVVEIIADNDRAAVRWTATGTHEGPFFGVARTGIHVTVAGTDVFHAANGLLTESWVSSDFFGLFTQLGAFPPLTGAGDKATAF